jgi:3-isopropylmalate/(R)-2-methylmalate dehydratase small subunit
MQQFKMKPFRKLDGVAVSLRRDNVDTDQVIPARYLKVPRAEGLGDALFRDLRYDAAGKLRPDFPLNDPARKGASVLIGRKNFGVGSSREPRSTRWSITASLPSWRPVLATSSPAMQ